MFDFVEGGGGISVLQTSLFLQGNLENIKSKTQDLQREI